MNRIYSLYVDLSVLEINLIKLGFSYEFPQFGNPLKVIQMTCYAIFRVCCTLIEDWLEGVVYDNIPHADCNNDRMTRRN